MKLPQCIWVGSLDCNVIDVINFLFTDGKVVDGSHDMATISLKCHKFTALPYMGWKGKLFGIVLDPCFLWITALPTLFSGFLCIATQESFLFAFLCHMDQPKVGQLANDKLIGHWYGGGGFQIPSDICFVKIKPDMFPKAYIHTCIVVWCGVAGHGGMLKVSDGKIGAQPETSPPAPNNGEHCVRFTFRLQCFYHTHLFQRALRKRECGYEV